MDIPFQYNVNTKKLLLDDQEFFPITNFKYPVRWNLNDYEKILPNKDKFSFTAEYHSYFEFRGDEIFDFVGDDDVWVYIDDILVIDLGGIHGARGATVNLASSPQLKHLKNGSIYSFDFFSAERHIVKSTVKITTTINSLCSVTSVAQNLLRIVTDFRAAVNRNQLIITGGMFDRDGSVRYGYTPGSLALTGAFEMASGIIFGFDVKSLGSLFNKNFTTSGLGGISIKFKSSNSIPGYNDPIELNFLSNGKVNVFLPKSNRTVSIQLVRWLQNIYFSTGSYNHILIKYLGKPNWIQVFIDDVYNPILIVKDVDLEAELGSTIAVAEVAIVNNPYNPIWKSMTFSNLHVDVTAAEAVNFYDISLFSRR